ncbi:hypothetical protein VPH35_053959 [Triticum aestivum]
MGKFMHSWSYQYFWQKDEQYNFLSPLVLHAVSEIILLICYKKCHSNKFDREGGNFPMQTVLKVPFYCYLVIYPIRTQFVQPCCRVTVKYYYSLMCSKPQTRNISKIKNYVSENALTLIGAILINIFIIYVISAIAIITKLPNVKGLSER